MTRKTASEMISRTDFEARLGQRLAQASSEFYGVDPVQLLTVLAAIAHQRAQQVGRAEAAQELRELADAIHVEAL